MRQEFKWKVCHEILDTENIKEVPLKYLPLRTVGTHWTVTDTIHTELSLILYTLNCHWYYTHGNVTATVYTELSLTFVQQYSIYELRHDKTNKTSVPPAKTRISLGIRPVLSESSQISLGIHPVWSESSLFIQWVAKDPSFLHTDSEDSDQTGQIPRLIWVFAGCTLNLLVLSCRGSYLLLKAKQRPSWGNT